MNITVIKLFSDEIDYILVNKKIIRENYTMDNFDFYHLPLFECMKKYNNEAWKNFKNTIGILLMSLHYSMIHGRKIYNQIEIQEMIAERISSYLINYFIEL